MLYAAKMIERVLQSIKERDLIGPGDKVIAAFSGGADSTALLIALFELKKELCFELEAAHFNHGIREISADDDEAFCKETCEKLGIPFHSKKGDVPDFAMKEGLSIETAARLLRYDFLYEIGKRICASSIAAAHHAEDNAESIMMHVIRGSGLAGLCGMKAKLELELPSPKSRAEKRRFTVIRPLLDFKKSELIGFLKERAQEYRVDETNSLANTARNRLRLRVLPEIVEGINKNAVNNIVRLGRIASEDENFLRSLASDALERSRCAEGYDSNALKELPSPIKKRAIRIILEENGALIDAEQTHIDAISELLVKQSGAGIDLPSLARARMVFGRLVIEKNCSTQKINKTVEIGKNGEKNTEKGEISHENGVFALEMKEGVQKTPLGAFRLSFETLSAMENASKMEYNGLKSADKNTALMDIAALSGELTVRTRRAGDRFHPVNSAWRMKLKDFFISRRVDEKKRDGIPLVLCGGEIVFIPGFLISDEVKLNSNTKSMLRIEFLGSESIAEKE